MSTSTVKVKQGGGAIEYYSVTAVAGDDKDWPVTEMGKTKEITEIDIDFSSGSDKKQTGYEKAILIFVMAEDGWTFTGDGIVPCNGGGDLEYKTSTYDGGVALQVEITQSDATERSLNFAFSGEFGGVGYKSSDPRFNSRRD